MLSKTYRKFEFTGTKILHEYVGYSGGRETTDYEFRVESFCCYNE